MKRELNDVEKNIYGKVMIALAPMYEKLSRPEQFNLINQIAHDVVQRIEHAEQSAKDSYIMVKDAE